MIDAFFAVTETSVYEVLARVSNADPYPLARKIALKGDSKVKEGYSLEGGTHLAITTQLQKYTPEGGGISTFERRIERVNTRYWHGHSSPVVALFLSEDEARTCLRH